jgi:transcriptional regulator with PAS, ATPase and Fis domain
MAATFGAVPDASPRFSAKNVGVAAGDAFARGPSEFPLIWELRAGLPAAQSCDFMRHDTVRTLVGQSPALRELQAELARVADSDAKVLITGESGTGKELVAREIHTQSARAPRPFVPVNCAGLPETLLESELFGFMKGSFTGAHRDRPGKLEASDRGTIFLDEIGEMTGRMQGLLLRFLETGEVQKVGSDRMDKHVDVRVIAATNRSLSDMVAQGTFREDLFYRLNVIHLSVPPLRERREDIRELIDHFLARFTAAREARQRNSRAEHGNGNGNGSRPVPMNGSRDGQHASGNGNGADAGVPPPLNGHVVPLVFTSEAITALTEHNWPGNVRELENVIERLVVTARRPVVGVEDLPSELRGSRVSPVTPVFKERRRTIADDLYRRVTEDGESFWTSVYPLYMQREITKHNVREVVRRGLEEARGNYKIVARMFNMGGDDYKRFLNFLRKHDCQLPFKEFR